MAPLVKIVREDLKYNDPYVCRRVSSAPRSKSNWYLQIQMIISCTSYRFNIFLTQAPKYLYILDPRTLIQRD